ncbi:MAG TPA: TonB-dependent receptor [Candidatus Elarobacter sp.]|nr:TonB-dependent receptor [Candidatus Elarobacter sp.]
MLRSSVALLVAAFVALGVPSPSVAATDASDVVVEVVDVTSGAPVALARVLLSGENAAIGYTDVQGRATFESVATGSYRALVSKRGYVGARSPLFEVSANRTTTVRVRLQRTGLTQIGTVSVSTSPAAASREVGQNDALRFLDGSLRDALGDLPGVTGAGDGAMIDGNDPSQTGTSIDGVSVPGAGGSFADRGVNADLFGSATASSSATAGSLGGSVGFHTLQPTLFPQQQATLQYGSSDASSALFVARGSVRNLGYVVEHAARGSTSPLTGLDFTDETGLAYRHDGDTFASGDLAKLRWSPSIAQTLTLTATSTNTENALVCAQLTALFPCGYGPNAAAHAHGSLLTLSENATVGATSIALSGFTNGSTDGLSEPQRALGGSPSPQSDAIRSNARGMQLTVQAPGGDHHDLSLTAQAYGLGFDDRATDVDGTFALAQRIAYRAASVIDRIRPNAHLTFTASGGINAGGGGSAVTSGLEVRWQPVHDVAYDVTGSAGNAGAGIVLTGAAFPDPRSLTFDCANGLAYGELPSSNAARQRSSSLRASVEKSGKHGRIALTAWTARLLGAPVLTALDATAAGLPPGYLQAATMFASSPYVCGTTPVNALAFTAFQPADQLSRGATLAGTLDIGSVLLAGYGTVQSRFVTAATPATAALTPVGQQVPGAPLHRAGVVATAKLGKVVDLLANVSYTAADNPSRLPAYTLFNAGVALPLRYGSLAIVGTNLANRDAQPFAPSYALSRVGGAPLFLAATPLAPRAVALTYTIRTGRVGASGNGAQRADASDADEGGGGVRVMLKVTDLREGAHPDALRVDPDNDACTPAAVRVAQPVMDAIGRIAQAAERAKSGDRYPSEVPGGKTTLNGMALQYVSYDGGARYVVTAQGELRIAAAFLNCARLSGGGDDPDALAKHHLYAPAADYKGFFIAYSPVVGLYLLPPPQTRGGLRVEASVEPEPPSAPADPFAERAPPACPAASKPVADALIDAVRAARAAQRSGSPIPPSDVADIRAGGSGAGTWLEIAPHDAFAQVAALQCLRIAGLPKPHLAAAGIGDARRVGTLGFADRFGFYLIEDGRGEAPPR